jgi:hypothetical protein
VAWGFWLDGPMVHIAMMSGASLAPELFTCSMVVLHTPLRLLQVPLTYMLDDNKGGTWRLGLACTRLHLHRQLLSFLGLVVSVKQSSQWHSQLIKYLGFLHHLSKGPVLLPQGELEQFQAGVATLQRQPCPKVHLSPVGQLASGLRCSWKQCCCGR